MDPLTKSYPELTPYQFASNRPIDGVDLDGLEYLRANEARIKMRGGQAYINLENFNGITRGGWHLRNMKGNWPAGNIGWPTNVGEFTHPTLPKSPESASLNHTLGAPNLRYRMGQHKVKNPIAESTGKNDRRYKNRTVSGLSGGAKGATGLAFALNPVTWGLEQYGIFANNQDMGLVEEHRRILSEDVTRDLYDAMGAGMIPEKYHNIQDLGGISNVILSGMNPTGNQDIYDIGIRIVKEISGNYRPPIQTHHYENGPGLTPMDNTSMVSKPFPKLDEE